MRVCWDFFDGDLLLLAISYETRALVKLASSINADARDFHASHSNELVDQILELHAASVGWAHVKSMLSITMIK